MIDQYDFDIYDDELTFQELVEWAKGELGNQFSEDELVKFVAAALNAPDAALIAVASFENVLLDTPRADRLPDVVMADILIDKLVKSAAKAVVAPLKIKRPESLVLEINKSLWPVKMVMDAAEAECRQSVLLARGLIDRRIEQARSMDDVEFPYEKVLHGEDEFDE